MIVSRAYFQQLDRPKPTADPRLGRLGREPPHPRQSWATTCPLKVGLAGCRARQRPRVPALDPANWARMARSGAARLSRARHASRGGWPARVEHMCADPALQLTGRPARTRTWCAGVDPVVLTSAVTSALPFNLQNS